MDILSYIIVNILNTFIDLYLIVFYLKNIFSFKETNYVLIFLLTFIFLIISNLFTNTNIILNQRDIFQHVPITSRKPVKPDSKGFPGFFAFWGSSRILANPGAS